MALFGLSCVLYPEFLSALFPMLAGAFLLVLGSGELLCSWSVPHTDRRAMMMQAIISTVFGMLLLFCHNISGVLITALLAIWLLAAAGVRGFSAILLYRCAGPWSSALADAVIKAILGGFMLRYPMKGLAAGVVLLGAALIFSGVSVIFGALYVDRAFYHDREE